MRLNEIDFDVWYMKRLLNTQAEAILRLRFLEETTVPIDADIPNYSLQRGVTPTRREGTGDLDASLGLTIDTSRSFVPIISDVIRFLQKDGKFCRTILARLGKK